MVLSPPSFEYQVGGSLDGDAPSYVTRQADAVFYEALHAGQFCYVLNSRQMGKSSLRVRTMRRLQQAGKTCVFIDLTGIGCLDITEEKWYAGFVYSLISGCDLASAFPWQKWWREHREFLSPVQLLRAFLEEVLLTEIPGDMVIFVDEIDQVLNQNFSLDDFFGLIRFFWEKRASNPIYYRLTFAFLGVTTPRDLIADRSRTPFNIGKAIELRGFTREESAPLQDGLRGKVDSPENVVAEILQWTGGQPFLTQKICQRLLQESEERELPSIETFIRQRVIENWEAKDDPEHLRTIRDRLLRDPNRTPRLLDLYRTILQTGSIASDDSIEQRELRLSGLVVDRDGELRVYNRIYESIFHLGWIDRQLANLRPYSDSLQQWLASDGRDQSCLLRGQALQDTLAWALGKSLGDTDYRYLVASQELAQQHTQQSLDATERASQILSTAIALAKAEVTQQGGRWDRVPRIALLVAVPLLALRFGGFLQGFEWNAIDRFTRWRSLSEPRENRLVLVTIDEEDIARVGRWPVPDRPLARVLQEIESRGAQSIGLDLYRDLPVEPGHTELLQRFAASDRLFGIEKAIEPRVAPPPILSQKQRIGFADQVIDADGRVRRVLLAIEEDNQQLRASFAVELALHYLQSENIALEPLDTDHYRLGKAVFERFHSDDGGYIRANTGGYQIWLDYRGQINRFPTISFQKILDRQIPPDFFTDRVVLIGMTAESSNDFFDTPYSSERFIPSQRMAGVVVHANIVSQILAASLDGRPLQRSWPEPVESLWILLWAGAGASIGHRTRSRFSWTLAVIIPIGGLIGGSYLAFLLGWWLPLVPAALSFTGAAIVLPIVSGREREKQIFDRTLTELIRITEEEPLAGKLAIEYLKRSESSENQAEIARRWHDRPR
jgi:adenylate cyclase